MDVGLLERLIGLVERSRVTELDYCEGGLQIRISRGTDASSGLRTGSHAAADTAIAPAALQVEPPPSAPSTAADHVVSAGMYGTFFRSPAPGQPPFVSEGDRVEEGQTLAILEAMKMLNPVEADRPGRILRILVADGTAVEAGTPLVTLAPPD